MSTDHWHVDGIKDNAALALMQLALAPERELRAYHFNAASNVRNAANLAGVADYRLRAMTGPDVWNMLFPHDREAGLPVLTGQHHAHSVRNDQSADPTTNENCKLS